ncbi:MAG: NAD(P)-dependent oxidoreductase [Proteobacteria bacterium]|nr:NAD(P)-dependent oxidoreductase [Pseudomonadota bacterium]NOG59328.1 NAD(P)-dependent oxidoreductase [Pseudomonadota bacterium]
MANIAVIGTGIMGREMVYKLLENEHHVVVNNRTKAKAQALLEAGAEFAGTPALAITEADFIISMVGDDTDSREVWLGTNGVMNGNIKSGAIAVECSSLSHNWILELNGVLSSEGIRFADCPVTGGPDGTRAGKLRILAGGDKETLVALEPLFNAFAQEVIHFGSIGAGTCYKLIVNLIGAVQATALAEGFVLAEHAGLDIDKVGYALSNGSVASPHVKYLTERMLQDNHDDVYFSTRWRHKDAAYALELAAKNGVEIPTSSIATELFQDCINQGFGDKNSSIIIETLRHLNKK